MILCAPSTGRRSRVQQESLPRTALWSHLRPTRPTRRYSFCVPLLRALSAAGDMRFRHPVEEDLHRHCALSNPLCRLGNWAATPCRTNSHNARTRRTRPPTPPSARSRAAPPIPQHQRPHPRRLEERHGRPQTHRAVFHSGRSPGTTPTTAPTHLRHSTVPESTSSRSRPLRARTDAGGALPRARASGRSPRLRHTGPASSVVERHPVQPSRDAFLPLRCLPAEATRRPPLPSL